MGNLVASLIAAESLVTTETKAKALRPVAEKCITAARKGGLHQHRRWSPSSATRTWPTSSSRTSHRATRDRPGGYTRIPEAGGRARATTPDGAHSSWSEPPGRRGISWRADRPGPPTHCSGPRRQHSRSALRSRSHPRPSAGGSCSPTTAAASMASPAQPDTTTVAGSLAGAIARVLRLEAPPALTCAGRTDAGVHARGQVSTSTCRPFSPSVSGQRRRVCGDRQAGRRAEPPAGAGDRGHRGGCRTGGFDARHSATARSYRYLVYNAPAP